MADGADDQEAETDDRCGAAGEARHGGAARQGLAVVGDREGVPADDRLSQRSAYRPNGKPAFNDRRLLAPIDNVPPAEAKSASLASPEKAVVAAQLKANGFRVYRGGSEAAIAASLKPN
jgi:hypothetical protein